MLGGSLTRYHPPIPQTGGSWKRFFQDFATTVEKEAIQGARRGARRGFKKGGRFGLPSISGAIRGAKAGAIAGAKRGVKRKANHSLDILHAASKKKINDIFG